MRNSPHTLDILQSLGFTYHIDEPSRDEPFIVPLKGGERHADRRARRPGRDGPARIRSRKRRKTMSTNLTVLFFATTQGPAFASRQFRAAVPDLRVTVEKIIVAGAYVTVHMTSCNGG